MRLSDDRTATTEYSRDLDENIHVRSFTLAAKTEDLLSALQFAICGEYAFVYPSDESGESEIGFSQCWDESERGWETTIFVTAPRDEIKRAVRDLRRVYRHISATIRIDLWTAPESAKNGLLAGDWVTCGDYVRGPNVPPMIAKVAGWRGQTMQVIHADIDTGRFDDEQYATLRRGLSVTRAD